MNEKELHEFLAMQPKATALRWWASLNCWEWPDDLPGRPDVWATGGEIDKFDIISPIMEVLHKSFTDKERRDYWQIHVLGWDRSTRYIAEQMINGKTDAGKRADN